MKTELVFILDKSGSMSGLEKDVIGGFNSMINNQKKEEGEAIVTTVLFDTKIKKIHNRVDLKNVNDITDSDYVPSGCTAMLDAIGTTINEVIRDQKYDKIDKTVIVITTDGMENSSVEYDYKMIHELIEKVKKENYEIVFLGANIDSKMEAEKLGIEKNDAVDYISDELGTSVAYKAVSKRLSKSRACASACVDESWKVDLEADYESRKTR